MEMIKEAIKISDKMLMVQVATEKAGLLIGEVIDSYFGKLDPEQEADHKYIVHEFKRMAIFSDMISDYLISLKSGIDEAAELQNKLCEELRN